MPHIERVVQLWLEAEIGGRIRLEADVQLGYLLIYRSGVYGMFCKGLGVIFGGGAS